MEDLQRVIQATNKEQNYMIKKLLKLLGRKEKNTVRYGISIFALDDRIGLSRQVEEAQRKQALLLL